MGLSACGGHDGEPVIKNALYVSLDGDDAMACTAHEPCASLTGALVRAKPGGMILVQSGRYPAQDVQGGPASAARPVIVRPAPGAKPTFGKLSLHTKGLELRGLRMDGWYAYADAGHLTLRDVNANWFFVDSASDIAILGGSVGPADSIDPQIRAADTNGAAVPTNIRIDGVTFHDFTNNADPSTHIECLQFGAGAHVVVRNSRFLRCAEHSVFVGSWGGTATVHDFTFEDNHFGTVPKGFYSLRVGLDGVSKITVRRNSAMRVMQVDDGVPDVTFDRNLAPRLPWECFADQRYTGNTWSGVRCGATDRQLSEGALLARAADLARKPGA
jgi:hypothetical protein